MKTLTFYPQSKFTIDHDCEISVSVNPDDIIGQFTEGEITDHFSTSNLIDAMNINDVIAHLNSIGYSVVDEDV